jgi:hypothetical protein
MSDNNFEIRKGNKDDYKKWFKDAVYLFLRRPLYSITPMLLFVLIDYIIQLRTES